MSRPFTLFTGQWPTSRSRKSRAWPPAGATTASKSPSPGTTWTPGGWPRRRPPARRRGNEEHRLSRQSPRRGHRGRIHQAEKTFWQFLNQRQEFFPTGRQSHLQNLEVQPAFPPQDSSPSTTHPPVVISIAAATSSGKYRFRHFARPGGIPAPRGRLPSAFPVRRWRRRACAGGCAAAGVRRRACPGPSEWPGRRSPTARAEE